jgi:hypothetical protein
MHIPAVFGGELLATDVAVVHKAVGEVDRLDMVKHIGPQTILFSTQGAFVLVVGRPCDILHQHRSRLA